MKESRKVLWLAALVALIVSGLTLTIAYPLLNKGQTIQVEHLNTTPARQAVYTLNDEGDFIPLDFTAVAAKVTDAVVNIRSTFPRGPGADGQQVPEEFRDFFRRFFGPEQDQQQSPQGREQSLPQVATGSGVIISADGYIVTNNHVVAKANNVEVLLPNNTTYTATVIGTDPSTDLALLKIDANNLPTIPFYNSDNVKVGEWVLAVGNPLNLNSTVTAGIISATGRNINIVQDQYAIESFIQTDAAINPGNSGGALVNLEGALVGINTAIASQTGFYSGYGFAIPSDIVSKVVEDLMKYGVVQRGVLGVMIRSVNAEFAQEENLKVNNGAYVDSLLANSAAGNAGIKKGDVIVQLDGRTVGSVSQLQELVSRHRPGDKVQVTVNRNGSEKEFTVTLLNRQGGTDLVKQERVDVFKDLGADFENINKATAQKLGVSSGVRVKHLYAGKIRRATQMREGFIITKVDGKSVRSVDELASALENKQGGVLVEGVYEDDPKEVQYYAFGK